MSDRKYYLDNLKVFLTVLVIGISTTVVSYLLTWLVRMIPGMKAVL